MTAVLVVNHAELGFYLNVHSVQKNENFDVDFELVIGMIAEVKRMRDELGVAFEDSDIEREKFLEVLDRVEHFFSQELPKEHEEALRRILAIENAHSSE